MPSPAIPPAQVRRHRLFLGVLSVLFVAAALFLCQQPDAWLTALACALIATAFLLVALLAPARWVDRVANWCFGWP